MLENSLSLVSYPSLVSNSGANPRSFTFYHPGDCAFPSLSSVSFCPPLAALTGLRALSTSLPWGAGLKGTALIPDLPQEGLRSSESSDVTCSACSSLQARRKTCPKSHSSVTGTQTAGSGGTARLLGHRSGEIAASWCCPDHADVDCASQVNPGLGRRRESLGPLNAPLSRHFFSVGN